MKLIGSKVRHSALTLIELLVVLSIVAVLSTVALRSVVGVLEEKNYDANLSQLGEIEKAVIGEGDASGFLGDIGRLPQAVGIDPLTQLAELWLQGGLPNYAINTPAGDAEIRVGTGWRGPYLNLGLTRTELTDGFGNSFDFYQADGSPADDPGETIAIIQSLGLSETNGGTGYEQDVETVFQADAGAVPGIVDSTDDRWRQDVTVTVQREGSFILLADGANLIVRVYGADGSGGAHTIAEEKVVLAADAVSQTFTFSDLPYGAKVLRAYQDSTDPATKDTAITTTSPERKSPATHVTINRFTNTVTLKLY